MTHICCRAARYIALTSVAIACTAAVGAQERVGAAKIGERAPEISLKDIRNAARALDDFGDPRAFVIVFLDASCAAVGETLPRLESLWRETRSRGGVVIGVNSNAREGVVELAAHAQRLFEPGGVLARLVFLEQRLCALTDRLRDERRGRQARRSRQVRAGLG